MSPEQARGEPVDARTDVWAFGCVLYEMLAGRRAFSGRTSTDVLAAVVKDEPGWDALPPSTPPNVRELVHRCLTKDAGQRPAGMAAVSWALAEFATGAKASGATPATSESLPAVRAAGTRRGRQVAVAALIVATLALVAAGLWYFASGKSTGPSIKSIAVLPLTNVSGNPDDQYFADGMTDALIASLGSIEALKVISRTSVMAYRGGRKPLREVARELKVDAIVEGSALRSGDRVRITAQLIDAGAGTIIWSDTYERDMRDVMTLQGDVARAIARRIQTTLAPEVDQRLTARPVRPDVYEDYLKGRYFLYQIDIRRASEGRGVLHPRAGEGPGVRGRARRARRPRRGAQLVRARPACGGARTGEDARGTGGPAGRRAGRRPRVAGGDQRSAAGTGSPRRRSSSARSS